MKALARSGLPLWLLVVALAVAVPVSLPAAERAKETARPDFSALRASIRARLVQQSVPSLAVAVVPWRRGLIEVCALAAAVLIALQLGINHWFYLYVPWFFGLVMAAVLGAHVASAGPGDGGGDAEELRRGATGHPPVAVAG